MKNWIAPRVDSSINFLKKLYKLSESTYLKIDKRNVILSSEQKYKEFMSCSYLGIHNDERIIKEIQTSNELKDSGFLFSSARTRMVSIMEKKVESKLNMVFDPYLTVLFQNVHSVHLGVIPLLLSGKFPGVESEKGFHCIIDKFAHQSLKVMIGIMEQFSSVSIIDLDKWDSIEKETEKATSLNKKIFILTDSLGSMGKVYDINRIVKYVEKHDGFVYFDDAHSTSILGKNGSGYVIDTLKNKINKKVFISTGLTKGFGSHGGIMLVHNQQQVDFIKTYATTYTFSGPLPNTNLIATNICCDIHLSDEINHLQKSLKDNLLFFDTNFKYPNLNLCKDTILPFRTILIGLESDLHKCISFLRKNSVLVTGASYPTVEKGKSIIRISLSSLNTHDDINTLLKVIHLFIKREKIC
ncbi:aminotransferase class I/II-fold pyridoxal phosphate-dependent enzyme [Francisella philomiragia]|uniref:aminotransferase class I/II-fold pyridoxal phosphate-dependent enzyme n=1 Tax=Francisella philomiragia TaxID=28110 RepID=UPI0035125512